MAHGAWGVISLALGCFFSLDLPPTPPASGELGVGQEQSCVPLNKWEEYSCFALKIYYGFKY